MEKKLHTLETMIRYWVSQEEKRLKEIRGSEAALAVSGDPITSANTKTPDREPDAFQ